jgi:long-subunit fatty acid transport protein
MNIKKYALSLLLLCFGGFTYAQNELDALKYSSRFPSGTAHSISMAGAVGAIGSEASSYAINPAALGLYRRNEFSATLGMGRTSADARYIGRDNNETNGFFNIPNLTYVNTHLFYDKGKEPDDEFVSYSFAFQLNRMADFNHFTQYRGINNSSSFLDDVWEMADGRFENELSSREYLAYLTYLLDNDPNFNDRWLLPFIDETREVSQMGEIKETGGMFDYNAGIGINYSNTLYLGISGHYNRLRYREVNTFKEDNLFFESLPPYNLQSFTYTFDNRVKGNGWGINLGAIYRLSDQFRLGYALKTATRLRITEEFNYRMDASFYPGERYSAVDPEPTISNFGEKTDRFTSEFITKTPAIHTFSLAYINPDMGIISVDVENINYSRINMESTDFNGDFFMQNDFIRKDFKNAFNVKAGVELVSNNPFFFRFGLAYHQSPFVKGDPYYDNFSGALITSGGIGIRKNNFSLDLSLMNHRSSNYFYPYFTEDPDYPFFGVRRKINKLGFNISAVFYLD